VNANEYTAREALSTLIAKVEEGDGDLAAHIRGVINAGKDIEEKEPTLLRRRRPRTYRRTVPYSAAEALRAAVDILEAYFVESPRIINATLDDFLRAGVGIPEDGWAYLDRGEGKVPAIVEELNAEKNVQIETQTETQITQQTDRQVLPLERIPRELIEDQSTNLERLSTLISFEDEV
jgi:hypothetical protein